jgi:hypothetical protein
MEGHDQMPDTRPIEDPAEKSKIMLARQGASAHDSKRSRGKDRFSLPLETAARRVRCVSWRVEKGVVLGPPGRPASRLSAFKAGS